MTLLQESPVAPMRIPTVESQGMFASGAPVLARDADATYWMSRYVERAEHVARLLLVNSEALIDVGDIAGALLNEHWLSVLKIMNTESLPAGIHGEDVDSMRICQYIIREKEKHK